MVAVQNKKVKVALKPQGIAVAERAKERRQEAEARGEEYVRDPWYYEYLSEEFKEKARRGEIKAEKSNAVIDDEEFSEELMDEETYNMDYNEDDYINYSNSGISEDEE